jgi:hypothetical protein
MLNKLIEMDSFVRNWFFIIAFISTSIFVLLFLDMWFIFVPWVFLILMFYTNIKEDKLKEKLNKQEEPL